MAGTEGDRIIAEVSATGAAIREYVWLDDLPIAVLDGSVNQANPSLFWVHADHLNRPVMMTDATRAVIWRAFYEPFGAVHSITGPAANDNRFPGQLFQLETGLAYNWHRHYDATIGRYTQADPLGVSLNLTIPNRWKLKHEPKQAAPDDAKLEVQAKSNAFLIEVAEQRVSNVSPIVKPGANKDGSAIYNYARQRPMQEKDPTGLLTPGMFTPIPGGSSAQQCETREDKDERCFNKCQHLLGVGHGNEFRGCYRRCMGQFLG
ncbi:MAG: hypothetical protein FD175_2643 [Beijerinckiaceae bacterium]|nr:MAG: hypothetical protein FD175_2643 [Beijerinckiaceae bacterium]